jgi:hypothetical protein
MCEERGPETGPREGLAARQGLGAAGSGSGERQAGRGGEPQGARRGDKERRRRTLRRLGPTESGAEPILPPRDNLWCSLG